MPRARNSRPARVLLVRPDVRAEPTLPLDLALLGSSLRAAGYEPVAFDLAVGPAGERDLLVAAEGAEAVYLTTTCIGPSAYPRDWPRAVRLLRRVRAPLGNGVIVVGGDFATSNPERCLADPAVDYVLRGEGERALPRLLDAHGGEGDSPPASAIFRGGSSPALAAPPERTEDLDALPVADYALFDLGRYRSPLLAPDGVSVPFVTSRGCPHQCSHCDVPALRPGGRRTLSVERAVEQVEWLRDQLGVTNLMMEDDLFGADSDWLDRFCDRLIDRHVGVSWECLNGVRADSLTPDLVAKMARAGCRHLAVGVETFHRPSATELGRGECVERLDALLEACEMNGIEATGYFLLDPPGASLAEMLRTIRAARRERRLLLGHFSALRASRVVSPREASVARIAGARLATLYFHADASRLLRLLRAGAFRPRNAGKVFAKLRRG